ncbi:hypothetical protein BH10ACT1_BH10ACT1_22370 [soil metagenome]
MIDRLPMGCASERMNGPLPGRERRSGAVVGGLPGGQRGAMPATVTTPDTAPTDAGAPLRVGFVGAGWAAGEHARTVAEAPDAEVVAVVDIQPERSAELAAATGARACATVDELLSMELDALVVGTPPGARQDIVVEALEAGLAVFTEKPISRTLAEARAIIEAAERTGVPCAIGYQWRAVAALDALDAALDGQEIGMLSSRGVGVSQARDWYRDPVQSGGLVSERGTHHIDLQRRVAGEVRSVAAIRGGAALSGLDQPEGTLREDLICLVLDFESGAVGTVVVAWARPTHTREQTLSVLSSDGSYLLKLDPDFTLAGTTGTEPVSGGGGAHPFSQQITTFLAAARSGDATSVWCTPRQAAGSLAVALACGSAFDLGGSVPVEPV